MSLVQLLRDDQITWHGVELERPDWSPSSHSLAFTARTARDRALFHVLLNAYWEPLSFALPSVPGAGGSPWRRWIDTGLDSPDDIVDREHAPQVQGHTYVAKPRSVVILCAGVLTV